MILQISFRQRRHLAISYQHGCEGQFNNHGSQKLSFWGLHQLGPRAALNERQLSAYS